MFAHVWHRLNRDDLDIMLEVKDKNLSCINCVTDGLDNAALEKEWSKYKYTVLEKSPSLYNEIRKMFREKADMSAVSFYKLIEQSLECPGNTESHTNALQHVWGYLSKNVTEKEKLL